MMPRFSGQTALRRFRQLVAVPNPAAGAEWTFPIPDGYQYRVLAVFATLVTSAVVANRGPKLALSFGGTQVAVFPPGATVAASTTWYQTWFPGAALGSINASGQAAIPDLYLDAGWTLASLTGSIDVGDQYSAIYVLVEATFMRGGKVDVTDVLPTPVIVLNSPPES